MNKNQLKYPIKFIPILKEKIWGGNKLNSVLNKGFNGNNNGESWEISDVKGDETVVKNGRLKGKTLTVKSPKASGECGCGESVTFDVWT